jgi:hypothetical protein
MKQTTSTITILLLLQLCCSDGFVIHTHNPPLLHAAQQQATATKTKRATTTELELSSHSVEPKTTSEGIWGKITNFFTPWWLKHKHDNMTNKEEEEKSEVILVSPNKQQLHNNKKQLAKRKNQVIQDTLLPFPWPIRMTGETITKSITRQLSHEQQRAQPLLKDAQRLIMKDKELLAVLGTPVHILPIFSGSSSSSTVNWKKTTKRIVDKFVVEGSKKKGVATLTADGYKKGHVQALRVDVSGIHYDIETK